MLMDQFRGWLEANGVQVTKPLPSGAEVRKEVGTELKDIYDSLKKDSPEIHKDLAGAQAAIEGALGLAQVESKRGWNKKALNK